MHVLWMGLCGGDRGNNVLLHTLLTGCFGYLSCLLALKLSSLAVDTVHTVDTVDTGGTEMGSGVGSQELVWVQVPGLCRSTLDLLCVM